MKLKALKVICILICMITILSVMVACKNKDKNIIEETPETSSVYDLSSDISESIVSETVFSENVQSAETEQFRENTTSNENQQTVTSLPESKPESNPSQEQSTASSYQSQPSDKISKLEGKTMVCFGDSITENFRKANNYPKIIAEKTGMTTYNVGFGGCKMCYWSEEKGGNHYDKFSMYALATAVATKDFSAQEKALESFTGSSKTRVEKGLNILKSIDFSKVDYITIAYGTNDMASNYAAKTSETSSSKHRYFVNATNYVINTLKAAYPDIEIILLTPIFKTGLGKNKDQTSDEYKAWTGHGLPEFVACLKNSGVEHSLHVIDCYYESGINKDNSTIYLSDGTHLSDDGVTLYGNFLANKLLQILS